MRTTVLALLVAAPIAASAADSSAWRFAVSGDSRNCGDVVMPAVAKGALADGASFYWHLGDFRKTYDFDEDLKAERPKLTVKDYLDAEWDDFIQRQLAAFGPMPVFLAPGNHELIAPKTRPELLAQFADWLDAPVLRAQRLADDPNDHRLKTYNHWKSGGIDFVSMDNASADQFDAAQLAWFEKVLARDAADPSVRAVVVGMHEALPNSYSCGHGMNESVVGVDSGRRVYRDLLKWRKDTGRPVYALASHSHFVMSDLYDTAYWNAPGPDRGVIPGWIVGTAGAVRYALPTPRPKFAKTKVYGYLLATVRGGDVSFEFKELKEGDVPADVAARYGPELMRSCFDGNADDRVSAPSASCSDK